MMKTITKLTVISLFTMYLVSSCKKGAEEQNNTSSPPSNTVSSHTVKPIAIELSQLYCKDLQPGDIMLKCVDETNSFNKKIKWTQKIAKYNNYRIIHAGIMKNSEIIIEAAGTGLSERSILEKNAHVGYIVYRANNAEMAKGVAATAELFHAIHMQHNSIQYNKKGLFPSVIFKSGKPKSPEEMDKVYEKIIAGKNNPMFCSQFVVYVYQWVSTQMGIPAKEIFNINDKRVPPAKLAEILQGNKSFTEVGYLIGNEH